MRRFRRRDGAPCCIEMAAGTGWLLLSLSCSRQRRVAPRSLACGERSPGCSTSRRVAYSGSITFRYRSKWRPMALCAERSHNEVFARRIARTAVIQPCVHPDSIAQAPHPASALLPQASHRFVSKALNQPPSSVGCASERT